MLGPPAGCGRQDPSARVLEVWQHCLNGPYDSLCVGRRTAADFHQRRTSIPRRSSLAKSASERAQASGPVSSSADNGPIIIGDRTSVQNGAVIHTQWKLQTRIGDDCVIGHLAHLEGCVLENLVLVGWARSSSKG